MCTSRPSQAIKRSNISIHAEYAVCGNYRDGLILRRQCRLAGVRICMRISLEARPRQQCTVNQRRMTEPIQENRFAFAAQSRHDGQVCHVTRGEQQRALTPSERRELFLEASVLSPMSCDQ